MAEDKFCIRCRWSEWQVIDDLWNHEFVCTYGCGHYCFADEQCKHYWPDGKVVPDDNRNGD